MPPPEIYQLFSVSKNSRSNTVVVTVSDRRSKIFLYKARSRLRFTNDASLIDLFLKENLMTYNFCS